MSDLYTLTTPGSNPVDLAGAKNFMKITGTVPSAEDTLINNLITSAVNYGEKYTGREFRANTWTLLIDAFADRIVINRHPVESITTIKYQQENVGQTTIASSVYTLKKAVQCAEIILQKDQEWPSDLDEVEHGIEIVFVTAVYPSIDQIISALYNHINHMYHNRGDCTIKSAGEDSGANLIYDQFRISRV
jgi:uncharacterized phiE125 gp8 family phage protein